MEEEPKRRRKKTKVEKTEIDPESEPITLPSTPPPSPPPPSQSQTQNEMTDEVPGRLYLARVVDQPNMIVTAVDDEHARELVWTHLRSKPDVNLNSISLFEPSIRFIQSPQKQEREPEKERLQPYSIFLCMKHSFWDRPGTVIVADTQEDAELLLEPFFKSHYILGPHDPPKKILLSSHAVYV